MKTRGAWVIAGLALLVTGLHGGMIGRLGPRPMSPVAPSTVLAPRAVLLASTAPGLPPSLPPMAEPATDAAPLRLDEAVAPAVQPTVPLEVGGASPARVAAPRRIKVSAEPPAVPVVEPAAAVVEAALERPAAAVEVEAAPEPALPVRVSISLMPNAEHAQAAAAAAPVLLAATSGTAGVAGTAEATEAGAPPPPPSPPMPTYRTRIPPAARVLYRMSRSGLVGSGELDWRPEGKQAYMLRLEGRLPLIGALLVQTSRGGFDAAGLAPERYTDRRISRGEQAANFQRDAGKVSFSGPSIELPLVAGMQDRLSVMLQLAAIANAWSKPPAVGERLLIAVVGARGDSHVWSLRFEGREPVDLPEGSVAALRFLREPEGPYDTRAEFWLDPAHSYLPVRVRLTDGKGDALELLRDAKVP